MEVYGEEAVGAGGGKQVRHQPGCDGHPRLVFFVRAGVAVVGHHSRDTAGGRPLRRVNHDQQLHEGVVHRSADGLHYEDVPFPDVLQDANEGIVVGELEDFRLTQGDVEILANIMGQLPVRVPREHAKLIAQGEHSSPRR